MPAYTTGALSNVPSFSVRRIALATVKFQNNSPATANIYYTGAVLDGEATPFAAEMFSLNPGQVFTRSYTVPFDTFEFTFVVSQDGLNVDFLLTDLAGVTLKIPLTRIPVQRITSEFRDNVIVTTADFAAISFQRKTTAPSPPAAAAAIRPEGLDVLATEPFRYKIVLGGTVDGTFVDFPTATTAIPTDQTALLVNFTCTAVTGGRVIFEGEGSGLSGAYLTTSIDLISRQLLANIEALEPVTLVVSSLVTSGDNLAVTFRMLEEW